MNEVSISHGMIDSCFVRICQTTLLGVELNYGSPLEFLFLSDSSVRTRYVLISSIPFQIVGSSSTFGILQLIDDGFLGYYEFQERTVFCVKHINEYQLNMKGYVDHSEECFSKFLVIYNEACAFELMKSVGSRLSVICEDDNDSWSSVYSSPDIDTLTSVEVERFPENLETFAAACTGHNVIVFRVQTVTERILLFLAELTLLKSDLNRRATVSPVVLCYVGNTENLHFAVGHIYSPTYTWDCSRQQQYTHFLSACILSKNNDMLLNLLGTTSF